MDNSSQLQLQDCPNPQTSNQTRMLRIFNTTVSKNTGQGFKIHVDSKCTGFNIEIDQVTFSENNSTTLGFQTGAGVIPGGGGAFRLQGTSSLKIYPRQSVDHKNILIKISNTVVAKNTGGRVEIWIDTNCTTQKWNIEVSQAIFIENINRNPFHCGGGLSVLIMGNRCIYWHSHCSFQCNTILPGLHTPKYCEAANEVISLVRMQEEKASS